MSLTHYGTMGLLRTSTFFLFFPFSHFSSDNNGNEGKKKKGDILSGPVFCTRHLLIVNPKQYMYFFLIVSRVFEDILLP